MNARQEKLDALLSSKRTGLIIRSENDFKKAVNEGFSWLENVSPTVARDCSDTRPIVFWKNLFAYDGRDFCFGLFNTGDSFDSTARMEFLNDGCPLVHYPELEPVLRDMDGSISRNWRY